MADGPCRWVGIDEAGYAPNLGPLVMTAVIAEGPSEQAPDVWNDLAAVSRAGGDPEALWVDDSKRVYRAKQGLDRLETACLAAIAAIAGAVPIRLSSLLAALQAGTPDDAELPTWLEDRPDPEVPLAGTKAMLDRAFERRPLEGAPWRIVAVRTVVVGPARFNAAIGEDGSKARAHFGAFAQLLTGLWTDASDGTVTHVKADKHGGRHFYLEPLYRAIPEAWIDRGAEGKDASHYTLREGERRVELCLQPRADADDGLVALASMISKLVRERWMDVFNAHWLARFPDLKPTAGYPGDAARFREVIEPDCRARGLDPSVWWRAK